MAETSSFSILNVILGHSFQFLLGYVVGVAGFTLSPEINIIIIQIGNVLKKYAHLKFIF